MKVVKDLDVVVIGGIHTEYLIQGSRLPSAGQAVQGQVFQKALGGKGANQAIAAARLGARVALIARTGTDSRGRAAINTLARENVYTQCVVQDQRSQTGVSLISQDAQGGKQTTTFSGANRRLGRAHLRDALPLIRRAKVVLVQLEIPIDTVMFAIELAAGAQATLILDPSPAHPLPERYLKLVDVIRANTQDGAILSGGEVEVSGRDSARIAGEFLLFRGVGSVVIQAGVAGSLLLWDDHEVWMPRIPVQNVDSNGAGDAFSAAIATCLSQGGSLIEAAQWGNAAAALATTAFGAQRGLPRREAVLQLLKREKEKAVATAPKRAA